MTESSDIATELRARIERDGPLPVAAFMELANRAYYGQGDVFGRQGDFITAPEISQTFGELIGLWSAVTWQAMGAPYPAIFAECGPGRGTLMRDALRATAKVDGFSSAVRVHLVEQSPALRVSQAYALKDAEPHWHDTVDTLPAGPLILIANEFLDALPVRQFERTPEGWRERAVGVADDGALAITAIDGNALPIPITFAAGAEPGAVFETSNAAIETVTAISRRVAGQGGAAVFIDYGHKKTALGDTLQAVKHHSYHPILDTPGTADLTAHVDFEAIGNAARAVGARVHGPVEQGVWLRNLGIMVRLAHLAAGKSPAVAKDLHSGVRRLIEPDGMGALFKVMAVSHPSLATLEGFAESGGDDHG